MIGMLEHTLFLQGYEVPIILLVVVVVFLFGAKKIPDLARSVGRARGEFARGKDEYEKEREAGKKEPSEREKLEQAAKSLGLPVEGKSDEELREAVKKALEKPSS